MIGGAAPAARRGRAAARSAPAAAAAVSAQQASASGPACPPATQSSAVAAFVGVPASQTLKAVFYWWWKKEEGEANGGFSFFILVRGDLDINEIKLSNALGGGQLRAATDEEIRAAGAEPGYASAIGLDVAKGFDQSGVFVMADTSLEAGGNFVVGANDAGYHFTGANYPRDFAVSQMADIAQADTGHLPLLRRPDRSAAQH